MRAFLLGVVITLAVLSLVAYVAVVDGWIPANADSQPGSLETWAAKRSLHATLRREASRASNPLAATDENLKTGIKLYAQNCSVCHGTASGDAGATKIARGFYQPAPQLASDGVEDDPPGVTYWKVEHGIRFTAMPSFGKTLDVKQIWQVTLFLSRMDHLPPAANALWHHLSS